MFSFVAMALTVSATFVVINIVFSTYIGSLFAYKLHRPMRGIMPRGIPIPIRPLDHSTMRRIARRPAEINPDSETIFLPYHQANHRPLQIMERISVPVDHRMKKDNFNFLNFDAYVMKPANEVTLKPVTERIIRIINQTEDDHDDARPSPSSSHHRYRTRNASKKPKKSTHMMEEFDDLEFYRAYLEHQKHAAMVKRLKTKPESSSRLPIGIDFFEHKKKNKIQAFPPITYAPMYLNNLHRSHQHEDVEASNVQNVRIRHPNMLKNEKIRIGQVTTPLTPMHTTVIMPVESEKFDETVTPPVPLPDEPDQIHSLASEPEMYKFTIDDVVIKPNSNAVVNHPFSGPVTLSPPSMHYQNIPNSYMTHNDRMRNNRMRHDHNIPANSIHENIFDAHYQTQINYPPKMIYSQNGYRHVDMNIPIEASASSQQQVQKYSIEPIVLTTKMTFAAETEPSVASLVKESNEIHSKRNGKRNKKRRQNTERHTPEYLRKANHEKDQTNNNNLEFSNSYSKRRTQGYNSEEEAATTPIIPIKFKNAKATDETKVQEIDDDAITTTTIAPNNEKVKYSQ